MEEWSLDLKPIEDFSVCLMKIFLECIEAARKLAYTVSFTA